MINISVIIPFYNAEKTLKYCIDSVISQTLSKIEIICIDNGSEDGSSAIIQNYMISFNNIFLYNCKKRGAGPARNIGLKKATGKYVAFMDADDSYTSDDVVELLYSKAEEMNVLVAGGTIGKKTEIGNSVNNSIRRYKNVFYKDEMIMMEDFQYCYGFTRFIFNRELILHNHIEFPPYMRNEDPVFLVKVLGAAEKFYAVSRQVYTTIGSKKIIEFQNQNLLNDIVKGFIDMLTYAKDMNYCELQKVVVNELESMKFLFAVHILKGNREMSPLLDNIYNLLLPEISARLSEEQKWIMTPNMSLLKYINDYEQKCQEFLEKVKANNNVIIYGAGKIGRNIYGYLKIRNIDIAGFAVSEMPASRNIQGKEVHELGYYSGIKEDAIVIIAKSGDERYIMQDNAISMGYMNTVIVSKSLKDVQNYSIV